MLLKFVPLIALCALSLAKDDKKWVWGDNRRDQTSGRVNFDREGRYEVYEPQQFRPSENYYERPHIQYRPTNRPGGVYGQIGGTYGQGHPYSPETGVLTGPVPSWVKEGPYKNFDKCKCTEKFNCNSPGISYGHCDVGKQYCCYSTKKSDQVGGPLPSRPQYSAENGVLVGPGGPVDVPRPGGFNRPRPGGGFGLGGERVEYGPISNRPVHSPENGILIGPGGPFDRPAGGRPGVGGGYGLRRAGKSAN
ncbi:uncharacterized protein LOC103313770 [Tribolium castaneum]|uniref:Uncharacterized protein n=1 Tax=Tribolium castaneum TaxID=7070 RepID=D6WYP9_TRICA|nr:PREDICTED: uncharacterized protein LOC103313770 [Tribolium castaneum]EFA08446.1 hypothetical protein TcasGA2_TC006093 [Tribolium castaneum]|eukprot:XP_008196096.1 PREDICTED: uncharacterized protein LOC103313770 [Tribolium castaneum]